MSSMAQLTPDDFTAYVDRGVVENNDLHGVRELLTMAGCEAPALAWIAMALVLRSSRDGHTCVDFSSINSWRGNINIGESGEPAWPDDPEAWMAAIAAVPDLVAVSGEGARERRAPFVIDGRLMYTARVHDQEVRVAAALTGARGVRVDVVLGGPGSGKTTWVATQLMNLLESEKNPLVALAAPTGKAARRMVQVLESALVAREAPEELIATVRNSESLTVHKLLEYNPNKPKRVSRDVNRPIERDLVIVDEASMLSLDSMSKLLDALADGSSLWLVGDPDQLASVDAGTVLADIAVAKGMQSQISRLFGQFRFDPLSPIGRLVEQVRLADVDAVMDILGHGDENFRWIDPSRHPERLEQLQDDVVAHARRTVELARSGDLDGAVGHNLQLQVLSGIRRGPLGVDQWNRTIEAGLGDLAAERWYLGRPVLVTQNDSATKLSNGDVGVVCVGPDGRRVVAFGEPGTVRAFTPTRLPNTETVHALTIHKSQGSEYDHAVVVLPDDNSRILTRELLYTGISRPKKQLTIVATERAIRAAVHTPVRRATGLAGRL